MGEEIVNKVAKSGLKTIDLSEFYVKGERVFFDMKEGLFKGILLKEKEYREFIAQCDWSSYKNKNVAVGCSVDTIIPSWAYMLTISELAPFAHHVVCGSLETLEIDLFKEAISNVNWEEYSGAKIIIKGCGDVPVPPFAYAEVTRILRPIASSIMFGEPCSTVPVYKKPKSKSSDK